MRVPKKKVRIRINILELQAAVDQKALVRTEHLQRHTREVMAVGGGHRG